MKIYYDAEHRDPSQPMPSGQTTQFRSRYNDSNHPVSSGFLIALLYGGAINPMPRRKTRRDRRNRRRVATCRRSSLSRRDRRNRRRGIVRRILQEDILYFFVVNLPTQAEIQQSVDQLEHLMAPNGAPAPTST